MFPLKIVPVLIFCLALPFAVCSAQGMGECQLFFFGGDCEDCVEQIRTALDALNGVGYFTIDSDPYMVAIEYDEAVLTPTLLSEVITEATGLKARVELKKKQKVILYLEKMNHPRYIPRVINVIRRIRGVEQLHANPDTRKVEIKCRKELNIADILVALEEAGFKAKLISIEEVN